MKRVLGFPTSTSYMVEGSIETSVRKMPFVPENGFENLILPGTRIFRVILKANESRLVKERVKFLRIDLSL